VQVAREGPALVATVEWAPGETDFEFEIEIDSEDFGRLAVIPENFYALFNVRTDQPARPELPDPRPNQSEILADGDVTDTEYEIAFWTYVECAEADGATFATITREESGRYAYSISAGSGAADACYQDLFMQVDSTWQIANE
jgi:hypothetical protein